MRRALIAMAGALILSAAATSPAFAGAPWISIEIPANPLNPATRNAFCLVRVYHHGNVAYYPVTGSAEGLVDGARQSRSVTLKDTGMPGVYAVSYQPAKDGTWLLVFRIGEDKKYGSATVVVTLNRNGQIMRATVPTRRQGDIDIPVAVSAGDIDRMLNQEVARTSESNREGGMPWVLAGLGLIPLAFVGRARR